MELSNKKSAIDTSKDTVSRKIECDLFQMKKEDYLVNGHKNWSLLRKHVYLVEQYCEQHLGGRIPAKPHISGVLSLYLRIALHLAITEQSKAGDESVKIRSNLTLKNMALSFLVIQRQSAFPVQATTEKRQKPSSPFYQPHQKT